MIMQIPWHLRITMESSAIERAKQMAKAERRSIANYVAKLIEQAQTAPPMTGAQ